MEVVGIRKDEDIVYALLKKRGDLKSRKESSVSLQMKTVSTLYDFKMLNPDLIVKGEIVD